MYVGSSSILKKFDQYLINYYYSIETLVDKASDCLYPHLVKYQNPLILVGPGNNGADGLSLALKLNNSTVYYIESTKASQAHNYYLNLCKEHNISLYPIDDELIESTDFNQYDVIVDGFFGFGLNSNPRGLIGEMIKRINETYEGDVIAIDIPSGLNCDTGTPYANVLYATSTICLSALKSGFLNPDSHLFTGEVFVETLDIPSEYHKEGGLFELVDFSYAHDHLKDRKYDGYKNYYGVNLLITGSKQYKGAPLLALKGAVNSGSGIVKVMSVKEVTNLIPLFMPEAIGIERPMRINKEDVEEYNSILIGCGIGLSHDAYTLVLDTLQYSTCPLVIDADALTIVSSNLDLLKQERPIVLTPHIGEFKRLVHIEPEDDLMEKAKEFALKYQIILVLKGPHTIITDGIHNVRMTSGNRYMSVGGMGDTLAGMITSFLGQHYDPFEATVLATYIHGFSGDQIAKKSYTVLPEKLSDNIPYAMHCILHSQEID